jgi:hypothetical protein
VRLRLFSLRSHFNPLSIQLTCTIPFRRSLCITDLHQFLVSASILALPFKKPSIQVLETRSIGRASYLSAWSTRDGLGARMAKASTSMMTNRACLSPTLHSKRVLEPSKQLCACPIIYVLSNTASALNTSLLSYLPTLHEMIDWGWSGHNSVN